MGIIKQLYQARLYVDKIVIKVFALSTATALLSMLFLFCDNNIIQGIAMSVIAAYIFYFMIEFIPSLLRAYENLPRVAVAYRHLQLLLLNLDTIFLEAYKEVSGRGSDDPRVDQDIDLGVDIDTFFEKELMLEVLDKFDLDKKTKVIDSNQTYIESFIIKWKAVNRCSQKLLKTRHVKNHDVLEDTVNYLIKDSMISSVFKLYMRGSTSAKAVNLNFISILGLMRLNEDEIHWHEPSIRNIKELHEIAFQMYDILKKDERFKNIVFRPYFYKE
mgnify:FL=1